MALPLLALVAAYAGTKWMQSRSEGKDREKESRAINEREKFEETQRIQALNMRRQQGLAILEGLAAAYGSNPGVSAMVPSLRSNLSKPITTAGPMPGPMPTRGGDFWGSLGAGLQSYFGTRPDLTGYGTKSRNPSSGCPSGQIRYFEGGPCVSYGGAG